MNKQAAVSVGLATVMVVAALTTAFALNLGLLGTAEGSASTQDVAVAPAPETVATAVPATDTATSAPVAPPVEEEGEDSSGFRLFPPGTEIVTVYVEEPAQDTTAALAAPGSGGATVAPAAAPQYAPASAAPAVVQQPAAPQIPPAAPPPPTTVPPTPTAIPPTPPMPSPPPTPIPPAPTPIPTAQPTPIPPTISWPSFVVPGVAEVVVQHSQGEVIFWAAYPQTDWVYQVEKNGPNKVEVKFARIIDGEGYGEAKIVIELEGAGLETKIEQDD